jgi:hypothetical protein
MTWSSRQTTRRERNLDYTFIVDRSKQTLERDLPLVIERIRHAGLAPIFVIDELDKLDAPREMIAQLIGRLKHLITDYGFFCFLTDREYYDMIDRLLEREVYPKEHTFFSYRLFVLYTAEELSRYMRAVIVSNAPDDSEERRIDELARAVLAKVVVHRSKLNTIDAIRQLARGWTADGVYETPSGMLTSQFEFRLTVAVQLAVEFVLGFPEIAGPMRQSPSFAQALMDALYHLSRVWESEKDEFIEGMTLVAGATSKSSIATIEDGMSPATPSDDGDPSAVSDGREQAQIRDKKLQLISNNSHQLIEVLCCFRNLRILLERRLGPEDVQLLAVIPDPSAKGLLQRGKAGYYNFLYSAYGREKQQLVRAPGGFPTELQKKLMEFILLK